jgi:cytochrome c peroxidase
MRRVIPMIIVLWSILLFAAGRHHLHHSFELPLPPADTTNLVLPEVTYDYTIAIPEYLNQSLDTSNSPFLALLDSITNEGATLGRVLFYEKNLSLNRSVSCGSCHAQENSFGAATPRSAGFSGIPTPRNSMQINHLAFSPGTAVFWDGRIDNLHDQVLMPVLHPDEMGLSEAEILNRIGGLPYYPTLFAAAFGDPLVTLPRIRSALVQFVASMASFESKFDQMQETGNLNILSPIEQQGWVLFQEACVLCHIEGHFGSDSLFNIGLDLEYADPGMAGWSGNPAHHGAFKSPTLRNIAFTAPYMHDGRYETLEEVVDFYSEEVKPHLNNHMGAMLNQPQPFRGFRYTNEQKTALVAFMHALSDTTLLTAMKWADPFVVVSSASDQSPLADDLRLFPNPANDMVWVEWSSDGGAESLLMLRDHNGSVVWQARCFGKSYHIPLKSLGSGFYWLEWRNGIERKVRKLIVL